MNHLIMIILNLFFLSPTSANICDFPREESFEHNYYECQTYLMKWSVAALWMIAISLFIFALTVSINRNLNSPLHLVNNFLESLQKVPEECAPVRNHQSLYFKQQRRNPSRCEIRSSWSRYRNNCQHVNIKLGILQLSIFVIINNFKY